MLAGSAMRRGVELMSVNKLDAHQEARAWGTLYCRKWTKTKSGRR
jgi:hypothetical protein